MPVTNSQVPLYIQIKSSLKDKIKNNTYLVGQKIPTEIELEELYGVSRVTVRKAINELVSEGYLIKKQGKGTFVNHKRVSRKLSYVMAFSQSCLKNGLQPSSEVLEKRIMLPTPEIAEKLQIDLDDEVLYIQRKRFADGIPIFLENNYFSLKDFSFLMEENLEGSLYNILEKRGIKAENSDAKTLEIVLADDKLATLMSLPVGTAFFYLNVRISDQNNKPIHVGHQYYLGEYYKFDM
ncbi:GntR family transcriptional regulator [Streptococcus orisasini]|uniref:GntR family transcriptional regulator n=1 Tax=Streptococcus orisasini TaxID=1080071 RepID=UPI00070ED123|nr:GntR family transcriptional regulator [Streptococcus orisasini]